MTFTSIVPTFPQPAVEPATVLVTKGFPPTDMSVLLGNTHARGLGLRAIIRYSFPSFSAPGCGAGDDSAPDRPLNGTWKFGSAVPIWNGSPTAMFGAEITPCSAMIIAV